MTRSLFLLVAVFSAASFVPVSEAPATEDSVPFVNRSETGSAKVMKRTVQSEGEKMRVPIVATKFDEGAKQRQILAHMGYLYVGFLLILFVCERGIRAGKPTQPELYVLKKE